MDGMDVNTSVFNYATGAHTVDEVGASDYQSCSTSNSLATDSSGATTVPLKAAGTRYFICSVPGHCAGGMKLAVTVAGASPSTPSSGTSSSTPSPPYASGTGTTSPSTAGYHYSAAGDTMGPAMAVAAAIGLLLVGVF
ncbi:Blue copper protein [Apostasia shenzhenica]|uniref:Blue copper protein n=1 Tax=Apostasia shenzhenica TaxID=1088818 RepID=A0A2I0A5H9_9ASPA|nr:Blue copper protein [Apostasia shenzhenica]